MTRSRDSSPRVVIASADVCGRELVRITRDAAAVRRTVTAERRDGGTQGLQAADVRTAGRGVPALRACRGRVSVRSAARRSRVRRRHPSRLVIRANRLAGTTFARNGCRRPGRGIGAAHTCTAAGSAARARRTSDTTPAASHGQPTWVRGAGRIATTPTASAPLTDPSSIFHRGRGTVSGARRRSVTRSATATKPADARLC